MQNTEYPKTLNLPQTSFSMKAGLAQREPAMLKDWEAKGLYPKLREKSQSRKTFTLHDGPPYANGHIHIGHALNKILKDMIVKMKTMQGFDSWYIPGWDCHGLPIEHQLFKELKKHKSEVDTLDFRKKAHAYALKFVGIQKEEFQRLGVFGDWDKPYLTLTPEYEYWILKSFTRLVELGYVYRGLKPVNWCASCETALAEAEVEYEDHTSPSVYVKFFVNNPELIPGLPKKKLALLIWTTTPWTLLANVAVAAHPNYQYDFVDTGKEVLVIESSRRDAVLGDSGKVIKQLNGQALKELVYQHPFAILENCRVILVDYVTREEGTGLVHTAPGHGQEDYEAGIAHKLQMLMPVNDRGVFTEQAEAFAGEHVFSANPKIIADLKERELLLSAGDITHSYPHCWRCKKPVIFRATRQWFMKIDHENLRGRLKDVIKRAVQWIPEGGMERILGMVTLRPDWCLSRQRHWGVPIPALKCHGCDEHRLFPEVMTKFADLVREMGTDIWFAKEAKDFLPLNFTCPHCGKKDFEKTYDILDVWFDSGVSHQAVVGPMLKQETPVALYLEGSDQHRGWFQSSLIPSVAIHGKAPFQAVLTHGFVVDGQGRKMSKSLGNVIAPQDVVKHNGVDILRLWVASSSYNEDIRLSPEILERNVDAYRKIRNTFRYLLGNVYDFHPDQDSVAFAKMLDIDRWALNRLAAVLESAQKAFNEYEFAKVYKSFYSFCNEDLSSFYLDILKDRLYTSHTSALERRSAQTVLYHILNHLVRVLAPILVFTSDEIFQMMPKDRGMSGVMSVHLLEWLMIPQEWHNPKIAEKFRRFLELRPFVLKALEDQRRDNKIGSSLEAKVIIRTASHGDYSCLKAIESSLPSLFIVSQVVLREEPDIPEGLGESFPKTNISIEPADGEKCARCWNYRVLGADSQHPTLCQRCAQVVQQLTG